MQLPEYAAFRCRGQRDSIDLIGFNAEALDECEFEFADRLPPLYEDLPTCPICGSRVALLELLAPLAS